MSAGMRQVVSASSMASGSNVSIGMPLTISNVPPPPLLAQGPVSPGNRLMHLTNGSKLELLSVD